ncbi:hypothetical protein [Streptomyces rubiginosohelvolus]|uniref:hypothetical protein n=1 Tax=Streptomyces rubiginosohelvolus TaxID=67362 RepID=UPI00382A0AA5
MPGGSRTCEAAVRRGRRFGAAVLDELLEALQPAGGLALDEAELDGERLGQALGA